MPSHHTSKDRADDSSSETLDDATLTSRKDSPIMSNTNPLLTRTAHIPFDSFKAEQVAPAIDELLTKTTAELDAIRNATGPRTFENTMLALDSLGLNLGFAMGIVSHLESVATTPEWRAAYNAVLPKVTEFNSKISLDEKLWKALTEYAATPEAKALTGEHKRFLTKTLDEFRRHGAELPPDKKEQLSAINTELARITNTFSQNTLDSTNLFEFVTKNESDLAGLPESAREMGKALAAQKKVEGYLFTLQQPSFLAIMTYADNASIREKFYRAFNARGTKDPHNNVPLLHRILELRREKAALLGFKDFSDLVLADRMAKNGETAAGFVDGLRSRIEGHFGREQEELKKFVQSEFGIDPASLKPWDVPYYVEKMRKALYDFDEEELRPFFPLPKVIKGLFSIVEKVFGLTVKPNTELKPWWDGVTAYSVYDSASGTLIGHFYSDLHPRETKRGGAWMNSFISHIPGDGAAMPHVGLMAGNFTPPQDTKPSLLTHDEVTTLFHEFGHLMHLLCSTVNLRSQGMDSVAWDFIELPSQILENWCWEREAVDLFASHYETGERIPAPLFEKVNRARNFRSASFLMRQLSFSTVDLQLHRSYDKATDGDILAYCRNILQRYSPVELPHDYGMIAAFTHLFSQSVGYAAGYYSYQWAEVLDADAFSRFVREGFMNPQTGLAFRREILSRGDSEDPNTLFKNFMGRDPDSAALLERAGLQ
jgi:oligopeptidase A